jgi:hypothetical protein
MSQFRPWRAISGLCVALLLTFGCFSDDFHPLAGDFPHRPGASVTGTVHLPRAVSGPAWVAELVGQFGFADDYELHTSVRIARVTTGGTSLEFELDEASAGTYRWFAMVDIDGSDACLAAEAAYYARPTGPMPPPPCDRPIPTLGDFTGWYEGPDAGGVPAEPNAVIPELGHVAFEWTLTGL